MLVVNSGGDLSAVLAGCLEVWCWGGGKEGSSFLGGEGAGQRADLVAWAANK